MNNINKEFGLLDIDNTKYNKKKEYLKPRMKRDKKRREIFRNAGNQEKKK